MNILMIGTTDNQGGAAKVSWSLASELKKRGHRVHFLVAYKNSTVKWVEEFPGFKFLPRVLAQKVRYLRAFILANDISFGVNRYLFKHRWYTSADIVCINNLHGGFLQLKTLKRVAREKKTFWIMHDMWPITAHAAYTQNSHRESHDPFDDTLLSYPPILWDNRKYLHKRKMDILKEAPITYISSSQWLKRKFLKTPLRNSKVYHIPNGIDQKIFKKMDRKKVCRSLGLDPSNKYALFFSQGGKANIRKGGTYFEALSRSAPAKLHNLQFLSIGDEKKYKQGNIISVGHIQSQKTIAMYLNSAEVLIFPSLADNCPLSVLEAVSCETPVLAFDTGGVKELISHKKSGYLARFKNLKDLERGLSFILSNKKKYRAKMPKKFTKEFMTNSFEKIFR